MVITSRFTSAIAAGVVATLAIGTLSAQVKVDQSLPAYKPVQGVSGTTDFVTDGNALRRPYLLGVEDGRIVDLDDLDRPPRLPGQTPESKPTLNLTL